MMAMPTRPRLIHLVLILAGLALLAAGAWYYSSAYEPVKGIADHAAGLAATSTPSATAVLPAPAMLDATLYFPNADLGSNEDCGKVFPVHRLIADTVNDSPYLELLKGPTPEEKKRGYATLIPEDVKILSISQRLVAAGRQILIDFSPQMSRAAGSCRVAAIRAQIEQTAKAIDPKTPAEVVISVNGETDEALQP